MVDVGDAAFRIQREHTGWNAFQDSFDVPAALLQGGIGGAQIAAGRLNLAPADFQAGTLTCSFRAGLETTNRLVRVSLPERTVLNITKQMHMVAAIRPK